MQNKIKIYFQSKGFTIVEFLVVIAIIAIIGALTGMYLLKYGPMYELKSQARILYSEIQNAKISAIRSQEQWGFVFNEASNSYTIYSASGDNDFSTTGNNILYKTINLNVSKYTINFGHGAATSQVGGGAFGAGDDITYTNEILVLGTIGNSTQGNVYLQNDRGDTYSVGTNMFGNISLRRWNGTGWN
jgi:prepilin-type N-terminal cleavage/methylation domain-containing protein